MITHKVIHLFMGSDHRKVGLCQYFFDFRHDLRQQVSNSATIGGIVLFVGLGVVVIVAIVTLASAATA